MGNSAMESKGNSSNPQKENDPKSTKKKKQKKNHKNINKTDKAQDSEVTKNVDKVKTKRNNNKKRGKSNDIDDIGQKFEPFVEFNKVTENLEKNIYAKGTLRINRKNYSQSYVTNELTGEDILISGVLARNRAFDGDEVVVSISGKEEQRDGRELPVGKVVYISQRVHSRICVGRIDKYPGPFLKLIPRDKQLPNILLQKCFLPAEFQADDWAPNNNLYSAEIAEWDFTKFALGGYKDVVGPKGDLLTESKANLVELGLDWEPVDPELDQYLPKLPFVIPKDEIQKRLDLRNEVIFTIDPESAKDLDDALSFKQLSENLFQVGVHIADPSYYLEEGTPLDKAVLYRASSIYLVEKVIHMLPLALTNLCSLLPGSDKLAVSVIWKMDREGHIIETDFHRSVIRSCAQLSYAQAQAVIEGEDVLLPLHNVQTEEVKSRIKSLHNISAHIRKRRFDNGAIRIDQSRIKFELDEQYQPVRKRLEVQRDSNSMIEEFMILANESVGIHLNQHFPKLALLRRHPSPKSEHLGRVAASLEKIGIQIGTSSSGELYQSMRKYSAGRDADRVVINSLCVKVMKRASYFCYSPEDTRHYALNLDYYTHFTSPIRRYSDIVVHRLLTAIISNSPPPSWNTSLVRRLANHSNKVKNASKRAGEMSVDMYRAVFVQSQGSDVAQGVVTYVSLNFFEIKIEDWALTIKVYVKELNAKVLFHDYELASYLLIDWDHLPDSQVQLIQLFTLVEVKITAEDLNLDAELLPPPFASLDYFNSRF